MVLNRIFMAFSLLAALGACAGSRPMPMEGTPATRGDVLELLAARQPSDAFSGEVTIKVDTAVGKQNASLYFIVSPELEFRGDLTTVFGIPIAAFVVSGDELAYHEQATNRFVTAHVEDARGLLLIPLDPGEFLSVITGIPPMERYDEMRTRIISRGDAFLVQMAGADRQALAMRVDKKGGLVREMIFLPAGVKVFFDAYRQTPRGPMPEAVRVLNPATETEASIKLKGWDFAPDVGQDAFVLTPPAGAEHFRIVPRESIEHAEGGERAGGGG